jgi:hypothetical protein
VILLLEALLDLAHNLRLFEDPLFLDVKLASQFDDLVLFDEALIIEDLSELLLVQFESLCVLLHFSGLLAHLADLVVQLLVVSLEQRNFLLQVLNLPLES